MLFLEIGMFDVVHRQLAWPWIAIDADKTRLAFFSSENEISTRVLVDGRLALGPRFALPADVVLPSEKPVDDRRGAEHGVHGFAIDTAGARLAFAASVQKQSVVVTVGAGGEEHRSHLEALVGEGFIARAVAFDRSGSRLWISAESVSESALVLIDASSHAVLGVLKSPGFSLPAVHDLQVHPHDDAVLLLAASPEGTFARVAGWSDGPPVAIETALDKGAVSAGFVGFSIDGARVHLADDNGLRTHAWPGLHELSNVGWKGEFTGLYSGAVMDHRIFVDGEDADTREDSVMLFDRTAILGSLVEALLRNDGSDAFGVKDGAIVTVDSTGDPARATVVRFPAPKN